ncbi:hypothetical protein D3C85_1562910 [compost metagenome]
MNETWLFVISSIIRSIRYMLRFTTITPSEPKGNGSRLYMLMTDVAGSELNSCRLRTLLHLPVSAPFSARFRYSRSAKTSLSTSPFNVSTFRSSSR